MISARWEKRKHAIYSSLYPLNKRLRLAQQWAVQARAMCRSDSTQQLFNPRQALQPGMGLQIPPVVRILSPLSMQSREMGIGEVEMVGDFTGQWGGRHM